MQERTKTPPVVASSRGWKSMLSLGLAALACPCHLPVVLILLAGTTLGAWISQHSLVVALMMLGAFVALLVYGLSGLDRQGLTEDAAGGENRASSMRTREKETLRVGEVQRS